MASVITVAGEQLFALKAQANEQLDIDTFIFANVPGQDPTADIDREETIPELAQQVHTQAVQQVGRINDNVVVYSTVLDSVTGAFDFNWVGLYSSVNDTLVAINHVPTITKTVTGGGESGNTLNRNFGIEYSGIAELTGITVDPETWQLDFTARLAGMDLLTQNLAKDLNGTDSFIDDGFKVEPRETANSFNVLAGVGYVNGLRIELENDEILIADSYPKNIYVDAYFDGDASSTWKPQHTLSITSNELEDYKDESGINHYVVKLATVLSVNEIKDERKDFRTNKLEVIPASMVSTEDGQTVQEELEILTLNSNKECTIFIPIGQSGCTRKEPRVSEFSTSSKLYTFNGGAQKDDDSAGQVNNTFAVKQSDMDYLVNYNENGEDKEGLAPGFSSQLIGSLSDVVYTWTAAQGSRHWRELKPGTGAWNAFCQALKQLTQIAQGNGYSNINYAFLLDHGESEADNIAPGGGENETPVTKEQYKALLTTWVTAIKKYLGYIIDTTTPPVTILLAPMLHPGLTTNPSFTHREVQQAQLEFCLSNANTHMITGKSQLPNKTDNIHLTGLGNRYLGEKAAQIYKRSLLGKNTSPIYMINAERDGKTVTVNCNEPNNNPIVIDEETVLDTAPFITGSKYGFEYYDSLGKINISNITVSNKTLTITLETTPNGFNEKLRCAQIQLTQATRAEEFKPRCSVRSSTGILTAKIDGTPLYNFMIPHYVEVN